MTSTNRRSRLMGIVSVIVLVAIPGGVFAQDAAAITGTVTDGTGAVMPGVTVEASSPALIEKIRSTTTDGEGRYRFVDLRPGVYTIVFTVSGFNTVRRESLELTSGFAATVNAEMRAGDVAETVLVTGDAPVVDLQNVRQGATLKRETLDALPTSGRINHLVSVVPGATLSNASDQTVGDLNERAQYSVHGSRPLDNNPVIAGMSQRLVSGAAFIFNNQAFEEVVLETGGMSAERATGGIQMVMIPKDGGNRFSGSFSSRHSFESWQSENVNDEIRRRGIVTGKSIKRHYDTGFGIGGPIKRDRVWFFGAYRRGVNDTYAQGNFLDRNPAPLLYEPDTTRPAISENLFRDYSARLTWQAARQHKIVGSLSVQPNRQLNLNIPLGTTSPLPTYDASILNEYEPNALPLVSWTYTASDRLLFEAGASANIVNLQVKRVPGVGTTEIPVIDLGRGYVFGSRGLNLNVGGAYSVFLSEQYHQQVSAAYVTGSHNFKVGFNLDRYLEGEEGRYTDGNQINQAQTYIFQNGRPVQVRIWATPFGVVAHGTIAALFVQDQWTVDRLTLNLGARFTNLNGTAPAQTLPAGPFVPERVFPEVKNAPNFWNLNPRVGAAYDLFGNGRTAVKVALGRFNPYAFGPSDLGGQSPVAIDIPAANQPQFTARAWTDTDENLRVDCDLRNPAQNGECGPWSDQSFGQVSAGNTRYDPAVLEGFNQQFYNWQLSASVQHEVAPNVALNVAYFRTWYGNFLATDNLAVEPSDYREYCVPAPTDPRLPAVGPQICGLYDVSPAKFGQVNNLVTEAKNFGEQSEIYNGVDITLTARPGRGGSLSGGLSMGRTTTNNCFVVDSPEQARPGFCSAEPRWSAGTQIKLNAVYPLPWDLQTSVIYQNTPGVANTATMTATNAQIAPSLGRNLAACGALPAAQCRATTTFESIPIAEAGYEKRLQLVDVRLAKSFRLANQVRIQGSVDVYNVFNVNSAVRINTAYGSNWLDAFQILGGRLIKTGATLSF